MTSTGCVQPNSATTGFSAEELDELLALIGDGDGLANEDVISEPSANLVSRPGSLAARRRGDATAGRRGALLAGTKPNLMVTYQPYGVNCDPT